MKKFASLAAALMLAATALAQSAPAPAKPAAPVQPAAQKPAPAPGATTPAAPGDAAAPKVAKAPEAKTPEEFKAYQEAVAITDPVAAEAAADEFAKKYPTSELRVPAYSVMLQKAYQTNDAPKIVALGRKVLAIEPDNAMTQAVTATAIVETTKETDLDSAEKFSEATKLADGALKNIETMWLPQPSVTPEQFETLKNTLRSMAYSTKGYMAMGRKDFLGSEENFQKAVTASPQPDAVLYLRLAVAQDSQRKYAAAFASASKSLQIAESQSNSVVANLARGERDRLQKLMGSPAPAATKPAAPATAPKK